MQSCYWLVQPSLSLSEGMDPADLVECHPIESRAGRRGSGGRRGSRGSGGRRGSVGRGRRRSRGSRGRHHHRPRPWRRRGCGGYGCGRRYYPSWPYYSGYYPYYDDGWVAGWPLGVNPWYPTYTDPLVIQEAPESQAQASTTLQAGDPCWVKGQEGKVSKAGIVSKLGECMALELE